MTITYTARTPGGRSVTVECASLDQALDLAGNDLLIGVVPVSIDTGDQLYDLAAILELLDARARNGTGGPRGDA